MPRTIVHVADYGGAMPGSFIASLLALCRRIVANGDRFVLICTYVPQSTWHASVFEAGGKLILVASAMQAIRAAYAERPDIIHTHFSGYDVAMLSASLDRKIRLYWHFHFTASRARGVARGRQWLKYCVLAKLVTSIVSVSNAARDALIECGVSPAKVCAIQNGIDTSHFRAPTDEERREAKRSYDVIADERTVLFYGRDSYIKGSDIVWNALEAAPQITVLLVGAPAAARAEFARRARVVTVDMIKDTRVLYWAADILAIASRLESWGFVLAEALSCGVPAAAADLPALREVAGLGSERVRFFRPGDSQGLRAILGDSSLRPNAESAQVYRKRFDLDNWVDEVLAMYAVGNAGKASTAF